MPAIAEGRIAGGIEGSAAKEGVAQAPGVGVRGVGDPGSNAPLHIRLASRPGANTIAQAAPAVAETAQIVFRQAPSLRRE
jgi:outer membrane lipoprotein SlyB